MQQGGRRRKVTTCLPCNLRKQKCNRQYPCNHCTRRRRPEECVYKSAPARPLAPETASRFSDNNNAQPAKQAGVAERSPIAPLYAEQRPSNQHAPVAKCFGYFEDSPSNTMALLQSWDMTEDADADKDKISEPPQIFNRINSDLERMPRREIINSLIQYFVTELNWIKQLVHAPSFLTHYQQWWATKTPLPVSNVEFAVLILRICSYATQFLPSQWYHDGLLLSLTDIRNSCVEVADSLSEACIALDWKGSLVRVQHLLFAALNSSCEGRTDSFWEGIASACRAAQKAGVHTAAISGGTDELEKEMQRRTFCNLYLLDSHLSRQLDRIPFLPDTALTTEMLPQLRLSSEPAPAPEPFTERLMQVHLGIFWRTTNQSHKNTPYDPTRAEQRYELFCTTYLPLLPPSLSLTPALQWDTTPSGPSKLPMQRQLLHIAILDSIASNFRPLLLLTESQKALLQPYKRVLLQSQKQKLAHVAMDELSAISTLHSLFDGGYTRFAAIIFNSFEASVLLLTLSSQPDFPFTETGTETVVLGRRVSRVLSRRGVLQAVEKALGRLRMLGEVSEMAAEGARVVEKLLGREWEWDLGDGVWVCGIGLWGGVAARLG
ncbi:hypothetical protein BJX76DRAFT_345512 [Aspergillus varians]